MSLQLFDDLDRNTALNIYTFLSNNRSIFHLTKETLDTVRDMLVKKYNDVEIYKLNPSIKDLLNNNFYKLHIGKSLFLVPLWHNELYFDSPDGDIIVLCKPELPSNITIDEDNNIHIESKIVSTQLHELIMNEENINIIINSVYLKVPVNQLYMKNQVFTLIQII
jgi:hypothetical protein